jgi:hypothetical protein
MAMTRSISPNSGLPARLRWRRISARQARIEPEKGPFVARRPDSTRLNRSRLSVISFLESGRPRLNSALILSFPRSRNAVDVMMVHGALEAKTT